MTEEDTFNRLCRISFEEILQSCKEKTGLGFDSIISSCAKAKSKIPDWNKHYPGWAWEEFQRECIRRSNNE